MSTSTTAVNPLGSMPVGKLMLKFSIPGIISLVINSLYNMVDQIFIGQGVGYLGNAATNVILPMTVFLLALGLMIGDGTAAYMSLKLGMKQEEDAAKGVGSALTAIIACGVIFMILFEIFLVPLCNLFGATKDSLPYCIEYGRIILIGFPVSIIGCGFGGMIRADGRPKHSMVGLLIGCITNIVLDAVFVLGLHWGMTGAAWATIIGQALCAIYYLICVTRFQTIRLKKRYLLPKLRILKKTCSLGLSSFINQGSAVIVIIVINNAMVLYGAQSIYGPDIPLAAFGVTAKLNTLVSSIIIGIGGGNQPILGYNYGSQQYDRVKSCFKRSLLIGIIIMAIAWACFQLFPDAILTIFGQESDLYMNFARKSLRIFNLFLFLMPCGSLTGMFFQAIGKPVSASILSLLRQILFTIPLAFILGHFFGVVGVLWAMAGGDALSCVVCLIVVKCRWKTIFSAKATT